MTGAKRIVVELAAAVGMAWLAGSTQHSIHTEIHVCHHITSQNDLHKLTGIRQRNIRGTEET